MGIQVKGFGVGTAIADLKAGDFFVGQANGCSHLSFLCEDDLTENVRAIVLRSTCPDQAKHVPYDQRLLDYGAKVARIADDLIIAPADDEAPFPPQSTTSFEPGALAIGGDDIAIKVHREDGDKAWVSLRRGVVLVRLPENAAVYDRWTIRWRDGDKQATLVDFGKKPSMVISPKSLEIL